MSMTTIKWILCLLLCSTAWAANDFTGDPNCVALWRFENGALTTDTEGSNTLTSRGIVYTPVADTNDYKEGSACVDLEAGTTAQVGAYFDITDTNLDSGFPLKSSYSSTVKFSMTCWLKRESYETAYGTALFSKYEADSNTRSLAVYHYWDGADLVIMLAKGYNGGANAETTTHSTSTVTGRWYHLGVTYDDSTGAVKMRLWDATAESVVEVTDTHSQSITLNTEEVKIGLSAIAFGQRYEFDGRMDEMAVFNDILTSNEIDQIRAGTFGAAGAQMMPVRFD